MAMDMKGAGNMLPTPKLLAACTVLLLVLGVLSHPTSGQEQCVKLYNVTGVIDFSSGGADACWIVEPRPGGNPGKEFGTITITMNAYNLGTNRLDIFNALSVSQKPGTTLATLSGSATGGETPYTATAGAFFVYFSSADRSQIFSFTLSWASVTESARGVFSLGLFVGTSIAVLLPILAACVVKFTLRKRFIKKLPTTSERQRINPEPPRQEQIIVWISVMLGLGLFILFTVRIIPT